MMRAALLGVLLLGGCATTPVADAPAAAAPVEQIAYDTNSWGRAVSGWVIGPEGSGTWYERVNDSGQPGPAGAYQVRHHDFDVGAEGVAQLHAALADLPDPAPSTSNCRQFRTDALYGTLRQTAGATTTEIAYNQGCMDPPYQRFMAKLLAADKLVASWGKAAPVARTERYASDGTPQAGQ